MKLPYDTLRSCFVRSQVALKQTGKSVKALQKLLKNEATQCFLIFLACKELGAEVLVKVERVCCGMLCKEYNEANQVDLVEPGFKGRRAAQAARTHGIHWNSMEF